MCYLHLYIFLKCKFLFVRGFNVFKALKYISVGTTHVYFFAVSSSDASFSCDEIDMSLEQTRQINLREKIIKSKGGITEKYVKQETCVSRKLGKQNDARVAQKDSNGDNDEIGTVSLGRHADNLPAIVVDVLTPSGSSLNYANENIEGTYSNSGNLLQI